MSEITELTRSLGDPDNLRNDFSAAAALAASHFRKKYFDPMNKIYAEKRSKCLKDPTPQIALLQACRPFMRDTKMLDNMINGLSSCNALSEMLHDNELRKDSEKLDPVLFAVMMLAIISK